MDGAELHGRVHSQIDLGGYDYAKPQSLHVNTNAHSEPSVLQPGDEVEILFYCRNELSNRMRIRADGMFSLII